MSERIPKDVAYRAAFQAWLTNNVSPATGKTVNITISKNGAAFGNPSGGVTNAVEIGNGWYYIDLTTSDTASLGPLIGRGTASGTEDAYFTLDVVNAHNAGFDGIPAAAAAAAGGLPVSTAGGLDLDDIGADVDAIETRVTTALPNAAPQAAGGLVTSAAGSLDFDDLAADVDAIETRVTTALPNAAPQAAGGLVTSTAGSLDFDDLAADVDAIETRVILALPSAAPQAAGGLITSTAGSLDMDDLAADVDAVETRVTTALPNAAPQAAGGLITSTAGSLDLDEMNADIEAIQAKTDNLPASPAAVGSAMTLTAAYDAAKTAAQAGDAMTLTSGERTTLSGVFWSVLTTAITTVGSIGKLIKDNLDAAVSTRLASSSYTAPLDAAGTRAAVGLASANLDTQLAEIEAETDDIAAIKAKTDNLPSSPAAVGDAMTLDPAYDAAKTAAQAGDAMALTSGERASTADALLDRSDAIETGLTVRGALRLALAALAGKVSGAAGSTITFRNAVADSKDRIIATDDENGDRTAITTDVT